jgi:hypothetical protein
MAQIVRMPLNHSRPKLEKLVIVFAGVTLSIQTHVDSGHGGIKPCLFSTMTRPQVRKVLRSEKVRLSVRHRYTDDSAHDAKVNDQQGKPMPVDEALAYLDSSMCYSSYEPERRVMSVSPRSHFTLCPAYARVSTRHARTWRRRSVTGASVLGCADGALLGAWSVHGRGYHTTEACTPCSRDQGGKIGDCPLALAIRTGALDGDADQRAPVGGHRPAIVLPIRMFAGQTPVIVHERFHRLR